MSAGVFAARSGPSAAGAWGDTIGAMTDMLRSATSQTSPLSDAQRDALLTLAEDFVVAKQPALDSDDLLSKYGFGDGDLLDELFDQAEQLEDMAGLLAGGTDKELLFAAVNLALLPRLMGRNSKTVELRFVHTAHNPARITRVDGLSGNEKALVPCLVELTAEQLVEAFEAVIEKRRFPLSSTLRPSVLSEGMAGLVDRFVEIQVSADEDENLVGTLLAVFPDSLVLGSANPWGGELVRVVPMGAVRAVHSYQLTVEEEQRLGLEQ